MNTDDLVQRISYFRNKKNLSARELSLRIGKSDTYINQIEGRNFTISLPVLFDIIDALELSCEEFFADNYANYHQDKEILNLLKNLSADRKNSFIDLMKNTK
ncbi:MAG: helix-turn-helix transcriptional regulator [Bacteroides sp.]|nr:helix-turn-helix transcriptional regulator [Bacillota bacterium]MCM1456029.1 helix-turn-helix transcriptional regulator [Bacteroides sp.]